MADIIFIGIGVSLVGIGLLGTIGFGIKSIVNGKVDLKKALVMLVPFVIFGVAYGVAGSTDQAAIITMVIMMALMIVAIAFTGLKGTFKI